jgi:hypothetical protein
MLAFLSCFDLTFQNIFLSKKFIHGLQKLIYFEHLVKTYFKLVAHERIENN